MLLYVPVEQINPVIKEYKSIKLTEPVVVFAEFLTTDPLGANLLISIPHPPP